MPEILYSGTDKESLISLEVRGEIEKLPDGGSHDEDEFVFVGKMGQTLYLILGRLVAYEYIKPKRSISGEGFTRLKIEGSCVTYF